MTDNVRKPQLCHEEETKTATHKKKKRPWYTLPMVFRFLLKGFGLIVLLLRVVNKLHNLIYGTSL